MKRILAISILAIAATVGISSCVVRHDDYYDAQPTNAYQYSFSDEFNSDYNHWSFQDNANKASVYLSNGQLHYDYHPYDNGTNTVAVTTGMPASANRYDMQTRFRSNNAMALGW